MSDPNNIVIHQHTALEKVRSENYAYIADTTSMRIVKTENCQFALIRERFFTSRYAFAVPTGWPYKKYFDEV